MDLNSKTAMVLRFSRQQCGGFHCCLCPDCTSRPQLLICDSHTSGLLSALYHTNTCLGDRYKCRKSSASVQSWPQADLRQSSWLRTGNGPSRPAMRRGWWESRGIPYCCLWKDLTSDRLPLPSGPVPHHRVHPAPPDCPSQSPGC